MRCGFGRLGKLQAVIHGQGRLDLAVLSAVACALAGLPGRLVGTAALVAGLGVLQPVIRLVAAAFDDASGGSTRTGVLVFGLHALNGMLMLGLAVTVAREARAGSPS